jgi:hypothetical protein
MVNERSTGSLLLALLAIAILGLSTTQPWFGYGYSSGRRAPEGGFHDANETGVERHELNAWPGRTEGDYQPADAQAAQQTVERMQWGLYAAGGLLLLGALGEVPGISRVIVRPVGLALYGLAFAAVAYALWLLWFAFPGTLGGGVDGPYTSFLDGDGYTMTSVRFGWTIACFALAPILGCFLFKYGAGPLDAEVMREIAREDA